MRLPDKTQLIRWLNLLAKIFIVGYLAYMLWLHPQMAVAQNYDYSSVEAYINDHKKQRSLLMARSALEYGNQLLHEASMEKVGDYKDLNADLDKYTRAFDVIDVIYQSVRAAVNVYNTYDCVSDRIQDYGKVITMFHDKSLSRGDISPADMRIIEIGRTAIGEIGDECTYLYHSVYDLIAYTTGIAACSTSDLIRVLENINDSLDRIKEMVNKCYLQTWRYVQLRIGFWKEKIYWHKTREEMIRDAFDRWRAISRGQEPNQ